LPASDRLLDEILAAADAAGARAMEQWAEGRLSDSHWDKTPGQPVSEADLACDAMLRERLGALLPEAAWLSEESAETPGRSDARFAWVVDPIDGTRDFVRGRSGWAVSVALVEDGAVQAGVLIAPARDERWWAVRGGGAYRNGVRLAVGAQATLSGARVPLDNLRGIDMDYTVVPKPNGIALRMAMIAANEADLVAGLRLSGEWDLAAADIITQEAGATITDALGDPIVYNKLDPSVIGLLCGVPAVHEAALPRVRARALKLLGPQ
jgi:myo-inositol-1(or 4)-monophosphatase